MTDRARLFGETIQTARRELRPEPLTQEALARKLNVGQPTVSEWESGKVYPTFSNLLRLAELLDLDVKDLVEKIARETEAVPA